jgi:DNA-binding transcriptional regulator of glucitol operon
MGLKEELSNIGLAFVWTKQHEYNFRTITKIVKDKCNDIKKIIREKLINTISRN